MSRVGPISERSGGEIPWTLGWVMPSYLMNIVACDVKSTKVANRKEGRVGFRFQRRISIFPGVSLNIGKRGTSLSVGPRGARTTIGSRGVKHSFGIPGTGIRYETPYKKWGRTQQNGFLPPQMLEQPRVSFWTRLRNMLGF